jgi:hypothetical protein
MKAYLVAAVVVTALVMAGLWVGGHLLDTRAEMEMAAADLESCRTIASRIGTMKAGGDSTSGGMLDQAALQRKGEEALQSIGLPPSHLVKVAPDTPRTVGQTAYREVPTSLTLRDMTLRQTVGFLLAMTDDGSPLQARAMRLSGANDTAGGDVQWSVELTLAYLVYQPAEVSNVLSSEREEGR